MQKQTLQELINSFQTQLSKQEALVKKNQDELNQSKQKLAALQRKEGVNLTVRDFTDDIYYNKALSQSNFCEGLQSNVWTNLLVVINKARYQEFIDNQNTLMDKYYKEIDETEAKRFPDQAKLKFNELKEHHGSQAWKDFLAFAQLDEKDEGFDKKAILACEEILKKELRDKQESRMPYVIVPAPPMSLGISDKEGNTAYRLVVYKP